MYVHYQHWLGQRRRRSRQEQGEQHTSCLILISTAINNELVFADRGQRQRGESFFELGRRQPRLGRRLCLFWHPKITQKGGFVWLILGVSALIDNSSLALWLGASPIIPKSCCRRTRTHSLKLRFVEGDL